MKVLEDVPFPQSLTTINVLRNLSLKNSYLEAYNMHPDDVDKLSLKFISFKNHKQLCEEEKKMIEDARGN